MGFNFVPDVFNEVVVDTSVAVVLLVVVVIIVVIIVVVEGVDVVVSISETCNNHQFDGNEFGILNFSLDMSLLLKLFLP